MFIQLYDSIIIAFLWPGHLTEQLLTECSSLPGVTGALCQCPLRHNDGIGSI